MTSKSQIQQTQTTPSRKNIFKTILGYIIFKLQDTKDKEKILKEIRRKIYLIRSKDKNYIRLLIRNYANQKIMGRLFFGTFLEINQ